MILNYILIIKMETQLIHNIGREFYSNDDEDELFSAYTLNLIRDKAANSLRDVHPEGKRIMVSDDVIRGVLGQIYRNENDSMFRMIDKCISIIIVNIKNEYQSVEQNNNLSIWVTQYGSNDVANKWGLAAHSKIKLREKRVAPMVFNMRY